MRWESRWVSRRGDAEGGRLVGRLNVEVVRTARAGSASVKAPCGFGSAVVCGVRAVRYSRRRRNPAARCVRSPPAPSGPELPPSGLPASAPRPLERGRPAQRGTRPRWAATSPSMVAGSAARRDSFADWDPHIATRHDTGIPQNGGPKQTPTRAPEFRPTRQSAAAARGVLQPRVGGSRTRRGRLAAIIGRKPPVPSGKDPDSAP